MCQSGQYGLNTDAHIPKLGVNHADELYLMWDPIYGLHHYLDEQDRHMSDILIEGWASFIKTGQPKVPGVMWLPRSDDQSNYLVLNTTMSRMERSPEYQNKMDFWEGIFPC